MDFRIGAILPQPAGTLSELKPHTPPEELKFYGGKVLKNPQFVNLYFGSYWKTKNGKSDLSFNDSFTKDYLQSSQMGIWKEYKAGSGTFLGSQVIPERKYPKTIGQNKIIEIISAALQQGTLAKPDGQTIYSVFLPPGAILQSPDGYTSLEGLGGYHGSFDAANGKRAYFAGIVYGKGKNGIDFDGNSRDNISIVSSHEWSEAVTDPDVNNGKLGWYNNDYGEIGDIAINMGLPLKDVWGKLDGYAVQKQWSNIDDQPELEPKS